uniref:Lipid-binding serum glycoprotein N-terminal domain-containing protein n=1 Tax=Graphocephala atropunctata TaxID=36148 RepID=A0A1B6LLJ1_9HEMI
MSLCLPDGVRHESSLPSRVSESLPSSLSPAAMLAALLLLLGLTRAAAGQQCDQPLINNVADFIMQQLLTKYPDTVSLANVSSSFLYNTGSLEATFGTLGSVSSIRRRGDLALTVRNNSVQIVLPVTFQYLTVTYEKYRLRVAGLGTSGSLQTTVMDNLIQIDATMGDKSLCFVTINSIRFLQLGDFEVRLRSSCKMCSSVTSSVTSSALNYFKTKIRSLVEAKVNETLYRIIKPDNPVICKNLHLYYTDD